MRHKHLSFIALSTFVLSFIVSNLFASNAESIQIKELKKSYQLIVPVSRLVMIIPKGGLSPRTAKAGGATASPRYYYFGDTSLGLVISGWYEPQQAFSGIKKFWKTETAAWERQGIPKPKNVSFVNIGGWESIMYDLKIPTVNNSHIRAHWLQAGTWIDIHLSMTSDHSNKEQRGKLIAILKGIQVQKK